jgi:hypothetical protein
MGGAISAVTRVFDALCASPFATRMGDTHHVATCTRTAVDRYRPDDLARAPGEQTRTLKIEHAARRKRHDQTHGPRRIGLCPRKPRHGRERGSACGQMQKLPARKFHFEPPFTSFDHPVGTAKQRQWHSKTERFRGLEVDVQLDLRGLLDRQVGRLVALQDAPGVDAG